MGSETSLETTGEKRMSAYVVDPKTINAIVSALKTAVDQEGKYPSTFPDLRYLKTQTLRDAISEPAELGHTMYAMNINAVEQRYPDTEDLPGTYTDGQRMDFYKYSRVETFPISIYKSLSCYLYQCSEGDVDQLPLYKALIEFKSALAEHMLAHIPQNQKKH